MSQEMYKEKERFIKKMQLFYQRDCRNVETIWHLNYLHNEEDGSEFVYVTYESYSQKRFCVTGSNEQGMLIDFVHFLEHQDRYAWLTKAEGTLHEEFMEDNA